MNLYIQLSEEQYEQFKAFKEKPSLEDHTSAELAAALLKVIQKEGGVVDNQNNIYDVNPANRKKTTVAKVRNNNFIITLTIEKY